MSGSMSTSRATDFHRNAEIPENANEALAAANSATSSQDQERWTRVKGRLRADVGDDIFLSWFARMDLERIEEGTAHLSVPTRFLKSWIQSHYTERMLACWQTETVDIQRIELTVRGAVIRLAPPKPKPTEAIDPSRELRNIRHDPDARVAFAPVSAGHEALGG